MSIKIIDTLEPANDLFKVVSAKNVFYKSNLNLDVEKALDTSIILTLIYYAVSDSDTSRPPDTADWTDFAPRKDKGKYIWQKLVSKYHDGTITEKYSCVSAADGIDGIDGQSPILLLIKSSNGTIYINNDINATLKASVYQENMDITDEFPDSAFLWEKFDKDGNKDTVWSYRGKTITLHKEDIIKKAVFNCILDIELRLNKENN